MKKIAYLLFVFVVFACKKESQLRQVVQGRVYEQNIQEWSANAQVTLYSKKLNGGSVNNQFTLVANTTSDANGNYKLEFDRERTAEYKIEVTKPSFFTLSTKLNPDIVEKSTIFTKQLNIYPVAMLEIRVQNLPPAATSNYLGFRPLDTFDCACCIADGFIYTGLGDTTVFCNWYGGQNFPYKYTQSNEEGLKQFSDTVYLKPFENNIIELNF